jgi:hypothetical protein
MTCGKYVGGGRAGGASGPPGTADGRFPDRDHKIAANVVRLGAPVTRLHPQIMAGTVAQAEARDTRHWPPGPAGGGFRRARDGPAAGPPGL